MNIAMWSCPRHMSTALMYSFASRSDTEVVDEPFYAAYLKRVGSDHPMAAEIVARYETDPEHVARNCAAGAPGGADVYYQKQMAHHQLGEFDLSWMRDVRNVFLIRHPAHVVVSYNAMRVNPTLDDIGAPQLERLYAHATGLAGRPPIVIDASDIRCSPEAALRSLCVELGIPYQRRMLFWRPGPKAFDGIWSQHWYSSVHSSTGFFAEKDRLPEVPVHLLGVVKAALPYYLSLRAEALQFQMPANRLAAD